MVVAPEDLEDLLRRRERGVEAESLEEDEEEDLGVGSSDRFRFVDDEVAVSAGAEEEEVDGLDIILPVDAVEAGPAEEVGGYCLGKNFFGFGAEAAADAALAEAEGVGREGPRVVFFSARPAFRSSLRPNGRPPRSE